MPDERPGGKTSPSDKRILLIDLDDSRRRTRIAMLTAAGYEVDVRSDHIIAENENHELNFDLIILALHRTKSSDAAAYSERLRRKYPTLPILLLLDIGVFVPRGTLSRSIATGYPLEFMRDIAEMLAGSAHIRELQGEAAD